MTPGHIDYRILREHAEGGVRVLDEIEMTGICLEAPMAKIFKYDLGAHLRDTITGFSGVAIARTQWMNKCVRYAIQPRELDKDGNVREDRWFDEEQVVLVSKDNFAPKAVPSGGPKPDPSMPSDR